jgi:hypothetical protein
MKSRRTHVPDSLLVTILISFAVLTASRSDMTVKQEITTTAGDKKTTSAQTVYWTKSKMRMDHPMGMITITDLDNKTMTVLVPEEKVYTRRTFDQIKKDESRLPKSVRDPDFAVQKTGEKKTIDNTPCEKLVFKIGPTEIVVWLTKNVKIDPAVKEYNKRFLELTKDVKTFNVQGKMRAAFEENEGYPYLTIVEMSLPFAGETQKTESKLKEVSYEKLESSVFDIPSGYTEKALPGTLPIR